MKLRDSNEILKTEYIFIVLALVFGILFAVINAPFQDPDEPIHFYRAYQISTGQIFEQKNGKSIGGYLPENLIKTSQELPKGITANYQKKQSISKLKEYFNLNLKSNKVVFQDFRSANIYSFIVYIPQSIGINIAKILNLSALYMMYFGRVCNLIFWTIAVFFTIKLMPFKKNLMAFLALTPMNLYQASSLSADTMTNAMAFLSIALVLKYAFEGKDILRKKQVLAMIVAFTLLAFSKRIYFVMCILFFIIPKEKFESTKQRIIMFLILLGACLTSLISVSLVSAVLGIKVSAGSYTQGQIQFVLLHPFNYIIILLRTFYVKGFSYVISFIGVFGWLDTVLSIKLYYFYILALVLILIGENTLIKESKDRIIITGVFLINIGLIMSALYVSWTPKAASIVNGIQGRYFIPIMPLLLLMLGTKNKCFKDTHLKAILAISTFIILTCSTLQLLLRFYGIELL